jgi:hypothetical protein
MRHFLATVHTGIGNQPVAGLGNTLIARDLAHGAGKAGDFFIGRPGRKIIM